MLKKTGIANLAPMLPSNPGMSDIHQFLSKALEERGRLFDMRWAPIDSISEYTLTVQCGQKGGDAEWNMYVGSGERRTLLWNYVSCDVLLVYNLVVSSCGGGLDGISSNFAAQQSSMSRTWRESGRGQDTLYQLEAIKPPGKPPADGGRGISRESGSDIKSDVRAEARQDSAVDVMRDTGSRVPVSEAPAPKVSALTGDIEHVQMPTLLQSVLMAKMTGKLVVESGKRHAHVYFTDGVPLHAESGDSVGEESIFDLLAWKEGSFHFEPAVKTEARTIKQNLDTLLLQGMQLIDNATYLRNSGLRPEATMVRKYKNLSEKDFEAMVASGAPLPLDVQKKFYRSIDENNTVQHFLEKLRLPRSQWIPLMCNMLRCDLVTITLPRSQVQKLEPKSIDKRAIQNVMMSLRRPETGMFTYPAFLYFLEQEYFRGYRSASPISIVVFQIRVRSAQLDPVREPLPLLALGEAVRRISRVKRHVDLMAHYETFDYALLLPNTKTAGAAVFTNRVMKALNSAPLAPGIDSSNLSLAFGIACIPEDTLDLSLLLSAAEVAKNAAQHSNNPVVLYKDIK